VHVGRLAAALEGQGHVVDVFAAPRARRGIEKALDVWDPVARHRLLQHSARFRPDVVHYHNVLRELSVSVVGAVHGAAHVLTVHDYRILDVHEGPESERAWTPVSFAKHIKTAFDRARVKATVDVVIAVAESMATRLRAAGFPRVRTVPNFADADLGADGSLGSDLVYAGQLVPHKGVAVLIEAFARISESCPGTTLRIAGAGPEEPALRRLAAVVAGDRVQFEGLLDAPAMRGLMESARAVCIPATRLTEGLPLTGIEAMLAGRPLVATDSPAFRELAGAAGDVILVPPDDVETLAAALRPLLVDEGAARALGEQARAAASRRYSPEVALAELHRVYDEALARHA
jgi:glycosyltransferase involved in cell wall biosynthesis